MALDTVMTARPRSSAISRNRTRGLIMGSPRFLLDVSQPAVSRSVVPELSIGAITRFRLTASGFQLYTPRYLYRYSFSCSLTTPELACTEDEEYVYCYVPTDCSPQNNVDRLDRVLPLLCSFHGSARMGAGRPGNDHGRGAGQLRRCPVRRPGHAHQHGYRTGVAGEDRP